MALSALLIPAALLPRRLKPLIAYSPATHTLHLVTQNISWTSTIIQTSIALSLAFHVNPSVPLPRLIQVLNEICSTPLALTTSLAALLDWIYNHPHNLRHGILGRVTVIYNHIQANSELIPTMLIDRDSNDTTNITFPVSETTLPPHYEDISPMRTQTHDSSSPTLSSIYESSHHATIDANTTTSTNYISHLDSLTSQTIAHLDRLLSSSPPPQTPY